MKELLIHVTNVPLNEENRENDSQNQPRIDVSNSTGATQQIITSLYAISTRLQSMIFTKLLTFT